MSAQIGDTSAAGDPTLLHAGDLTLDCSMQRVDVDGDSVALSRLECGLLRILIEHHDRVVPSRHLLDELWGPDFVGDPGTLPVHILRLRTKLERRHHAHTRIRTIRGVGYALDTHPPSA